MWNWDHRLLDAFTTSLQERNGDHNHDTWASVSWVGCEGPSLWWLVRLPCGQLCGQWLFSQTSSWTRSCFSHRTGGVSLFIRPLPGPFPGVTMTCYWCISWNCQEWRYVYLVYFISFPPFRSEFSCVGLAQWVIKTWNGGEHIIKKTDIYTLASGESGDPPALHGRRTKRAERPTLLLAEVTWGNS